MRLIFSFSPQHVVLDVVQNVCRHWRMLNQEQTTWKWVNVRDLLKRRSHGLISSQLRDASCAQISTGKDAALVTQYCKRLTSLKLADINSTHGSFAVRTNFLRKLPLLQSLDIRQATSGSSKNLNLAVLPNLTDLRIGIYFELDRPLKSNSLTSLSVSCGNEVSVKSTYLKNLAGSLPQLRSLALDCSTFSYQDLEEIMEWPCVRHEVLRHFVLDCSPCWYTGTFTESSSPN